MKALIVGLLLFCTAYTANGQDKVKTWIFFSDKLDRAGKHTLLETEYLTPQAKERRLIRGNLQLTQ